MIEFYQGERRTIRVTITTAGDPAAGEMVKGVERAPQSGVGETPKSSSSDGQQGARTALGASRPSSLGLIGPTLF